MPIPRTIRGRRSSASGAHPTPRERSRARTRARRARSGHRASATTRTTRGSAPRRCLPPAGTCPRACDRAAALPRPTTRRCGTSRPSATIPPGSPSARPADGSGSSAATRGAGVIPGPPPGASTRAGDRSSAPGLGVGNEREDEAPDLDIVALGDPGGFEHPEDTFAAEVALELRQFVRVIEVALEDPPLDASPLHVPCAALIALDREARPPGTEHDVRAPLRLGGCGLAREGVHALAELLEPRAGDRGDRERVRLQR